MSIQHETTTGLLSNLGIDPLHTSPALEQLTAADSRFLRDLKLNVSSVLSSASLTKQEAFLLALSVAANEKHTILIQAFTQLATNEGATAAAIAETHACTAVMNVNNIFYRFRHYMAGVEFYEKQPAGIRMSVMMNPVLGKEFFELMSLTVSAVNGCERCVTSHENAVKQHGASQQRIYDAIRLAGVIKSLCITL